MMKKMFFMLSICLMANCTASFAQLSKEQQKERTETRKLSKAQLNEKATKTARKEAKKLAKEGWQAAPGALPLDKQLDKSYMMQMEYDEDMFPKYIIIHHAAPPLFMKCSTVFLIFFVSITSQFSST